MTQKVTIELMDDIDQSKAAETVAFALDGTHYEIDLSVSHAKDIREALGGFVTAARRTGGKRRVSRQSKSSAVKSSTAQHGDSATEVRDWARKNGHTVSDRGRIPAAVVSAFVKAQA